MKRHLTEAGCWPAALGLGARLARFLADADLDRGVCHMDLTLDNVHLSGEDLTVFDFDSAGMCWRALEPHGVLKHSRSSFDAWLAGYRSVREFATADEDAVSAFTVLGDLRVVAWKLGVAASSRWGAAARRRADLPAVVDRWLELRNRPAGDVEGRRPQRGRWTGSQPRRGSRVPAVAARDR